ncbi:MAG: hypothetical protein QOE96_3790 [Blastocatellia bacterium]|jgi:hypothetical protein|nr:hypothetical protein [Blastocatellia bacterium]
MMMSIFCGSSCEELAAPVDVGEVEGFVPRLLGVLELRESLL